MSDLSDGTERLLALCFPGSRIRVIVKRDSAAPCALHWVPGRGPLRDVPGAPVIREADFVAPAAISGAPADPAEITATVVIGSERGSSPTFAWRPRDKLQGFLFERFPIAFEQVKYTYECFLAWRTARQVRRVDLRRPELLSSRIREARPTLIVAMYWLDTGGAESFALQCVAQAQALGLEVVLLCDHPAQTSPSRLPAGVELLRSDLLCDDALYRRLVMGLLDQRNVVAIHIHHSGRMYALVAELSSQADRPVIIDTTHIVEYRDGGYVHLSGSLTRAIDHHHLISRTLQAYYRDHFDRTDNVHLGYLHDSKAAQAPMPFSILIEKPVVTVGFVGRLAHQKRPMLFLEIARRLIAVQSRHGLRFRFVVIGDGAYSAALTRMSEVLGIDKVIEFLGHREDAGCLMQEIDIVVAPSANEGLTLIGYEAFRGGALMLSTDVGAQHELIPADLLLDPSPFACCRSAARIILRLATDRDFAARQVRSFTDLYRDLATGPAASQVIPDIYAGAIHGQQPAVASPARSAGEWPRS